MKRRESLEPNKFFELAECIFVPFRSANVVAGSECVLGVETEAQTLVIDDHVEYLRHLFESVAEVTALTCRDLERDLHLEAFARGVYLVDRFCDHIHTGLDEGSDMRSRMRDENRHTERLASMQLVDNSIYRLETHRFIRRAEIHQVGIVRDHGRDAGILPIALEGFDFLVGERLRRPMPRRLGENLDTFAADPLAANQRLANFAGNRHVRAQHRTTRFACVCHREVPHFPSSRWTRAHRDFIRSCPRRLSVDTSLLVRIAILILTLAAAGCAHVASLPPQVTLSEVEPSGRAAKPPDCDMPVLRHEPLKDFRRVAIVEALGNVYASEADVLPAVQRKACETGADAIIVLTSKSQTTETATGYYINSVAIVYGKENPAAAGTAYKIKIPPGN